MNHVDQSGATPLAALCANKSFNVERQVAVKVSQIGRNQTLRSNLTKS